jgi:hypothetical protein
VRRPDQEAPKVKALLRDLADLPLGCQSDYQLAMAALDLSYRARALIIAEEEALEAIELSDARLTAKQTRNPIAPGFEP